MNDDRAMQLIYEITTVFTPGAPIDRRALFAGRTGQVIDVINAISQRGQHVVLFGERGVGKTSLANVLSEILSQSGFQRMESGTINCDGTDTFSTIWHKIFREIPFEKEIMSAGFTAEPSTNKSSLDQFLNKKVSPDDIRHLLQRIGKSTTIIIDEVDRIKDKETTRLIADTIKTLSDHSVNTTLILLGVADSVDGLISEHQSIERALMQVRMPRMSVNELLEIIDKGLDKVQMTIDQDAKIRIAQLSQGLPHYTHLLGLHGAQTALGDNRMNITMFDIEAAIKLAVSKAQQSILSAYHRATSSSQKETLYARVLLACALARTDDLGYFSAVDVRHPMTLIMGKKYEIPAFSRHLNDFCEEKRGPVLQKTGSARRFRFRFINPLMQPFVVIHGLAKGLLTDELLTTTLSEEIHVTPKFEFQ